MIGPIVIVLLINLIFTGICIANVFDDHWPSRVWGAKQLRWFPPLTGVFLLVINGVCWAMRAAADTKRQTVEVLTEAKLVERQGGQVSVLPASDHPADRSDF